MIDQLVDQKYRVVRLLGEGGMGAVYEAEHTGTGRRVALKVIAATGLGNPEFVSRFQREARAAGSIDTQHIVQVFDSGTDAASSQPFLVMELLTGEDLEQLLARMGPLQPDLALRIIAQACLGLKKAHEVRVIHRDIKPANLFLARREAGDSVVKILDFGVAKVKRDSAKVGDVTLTGVGGLLGSPSYMSPEQALGLTNVDHRTDIWSLGVVLFEALSGALPHKVESVGQLLLSIPTKDPIPLLEVAPSIAPEIASVVDRALRRDANNRFQTAEEMGDAIRKLLPKGVTIEGEMISHGGRTKTALRVERQSASTAAPVAIRIKDEPTPSPSSPSSGSVGTPHTPGTPHSLIADPKTPGADSQFGKYQLIAALGHGGMADAYLAVASGPAEVGFNKLVVVKRLRPNLAEDPESLAMLLDEARLAARLNHPNLIQTNEVGQQGKQYFIAMEYLDGQPLHRIQHRARERLSRELSYRILSDVLQGLQYAHDLCDYDGTALEVVHRDVSPHNVFVTYAGHVKVVDFGIAKAVGRSIETRTGVAKGKITYMAPEQALAHGVDRRADIFSVGVMLWEAATGTRLWKGLQEVQIMQRLLSGSIPASPREQNPDVPEAIERICRRALQLRPEDRYPTAEAFRQDLDAYLESISGATSAEANRVGARDTHNELGKFVAELFAAERAELKLVIEQQLMALTQRPSRGVEIAPLSSLDTRATPPSGSSQSIGRPVAARTDGSVPSASTPRRSSVSKMGLGVAAAVVLVGGMWVIMREPSAAAPEPPASSATIAAPESVRPAPEVRVSLRASPAEARLTLDDTPLTGNPYLGSHARETAEHHLHVEAAGFQPQTRTVTFDADVDLTVALQPSPAGVATPAGHPTPVIRPVVTAAPAPSVLPTAKPSGTRPKRPIDETNPMRPSGAGNP